MRGGARYTLGMKIKGSLSAALFALCIFLGILLGFLVPVAASAQTQSQDQLRATIKAEITADPRSQTMTQAQINALVDSLTTQAEKQGLTATQLTYKPGMPETSGTTLTSCSDISCSLAYAFGLDGSIPIIPIALFVIAALFILIYGIMREMGHPHTKAY
jgi:hypothetical protein